MSPDLHAKSIVIDGLIISDFGRPMFEDMRRGGLTAVNCTCCVWEGRKLLRQFKPRFLETLAVALAVYPEAQVSEANDGMVLYPSPPAIPKPDGRRLGLL